MESVFLAGWGLAGPPPAEPPATEGRERRTHISVIYNLNALDALTSEELAVLPGDTAPLADTSRDLKGLPKE